MGWGNILGGPDQSARPTCPLLIRPYFFCLFFVLLSNEERTRGLGSLNHPIFSRGLVGPFRWRYFFQRIVQSAGVDYPFYTRAGNLRPFIIINVQLRSPLTAGISLDGFEIQPALDCVDTSFSSYIISVYIYTNMQKLCPALRSSTQTYMQS